MPLSISRQEAQSPTDPTVRIASSISICSASRSRIQTRSWSEVGKKTQEAGKRLRKEENVSGKEGRTDEEKA